MYLSCRSSKLFLRKSGMISWVCSESHYLPLLGLMRGNALSEVWKWMHKFYLIACLLILTKLNGKAVCLWTNIRYHTLHYYSMEVTYVLSVVYDTFLWLLHLCLKLPIQQFPGDSGVLGSMFTCSSCKTMYALLNCENYDILPYPYHLSRYRGCKLSCPLKKFLLLPSMYYLLSKYSFRLRVEPNSPDLIFASILGNCWSEFNHIDKTGLLDGLWTWSPCCFRLFSFYFYQGLHYLCSVQCAVYILWFISYFVVLIVQLCNILILQEPKLNNRPYGWAE